MPGALGILLLTTVVAGAAAETETAPIAEVTISSSGLQFQTLVSLNEVGKWLLRVVGPVSRILEFDAAEPIWIDLGETVFPDGTYVYELRAIVQRESESNEDSGLADAPSHPSSNPRPLTGTFVVEGGAVGAPQPEVAPRCGR